ncbi:MAG: hypothetical protein RL220_1745 [Bacteroidota bacterium]
MKHLAALVLLFSGLCTHIVYSQQFTDIATNNGINIINNNPLFGNGVGVFDIDRDGWDDLTFATKNNGIKFYRNMGGTFTIWNISFSPSIPTNLDIKSFLWFDYDNDGDYDFTYSGILNAGAGNWPLKFYRNEGNFNMVEVSSSIGILPETPQIFGVTAGDYNNDSYLDLFVCKYHNVDFWSGYQYSNRLYRNNGDGTFTDATLEANLPTPIQASFYAVFFDYDQDGFQDIYVANDRIQYINYLYHNLGDGTFEDVSLSSGAGVAIEAMTATIGDYDRDEDMDIYVSNTNWGNVLLRNENDGTFTDVAEDAGVLAFQVCWGANWIDYDNNGWEDLYILTLGSGFTVEDLNIFYQNNEDGTFTQINTELGLQNDDEGGYCNAIGDFNNDGYYDMVNNNTLSAADIYLNAGGDNHYICCELEGTLTNKDGVGAWIELWTDGEYHARYTMRGESYMALNSRKKIIGIGSHTTVDSLKITWLGGFVEMYYDLEADQCYEFLEGASTTLLPASIQYEGDLFICPGESIVLTAQEGASYFWSNGLMTQSIEVSEPGYYSVGVENIYGLFQYSDNILVSPAPELTWESSVNNVSCHGLADATATLTPATENCIITWFDESQSAQIDSLSPGEYSYSIIDPYGCPYEGSVSVNEPPVLISSITTSDVLCFGENNGTAQVSATGGNGEPFSLEWSNGSDPDALPAGDYSVIVIDALGCDTTIIFSISEPAELTASVSTTNSETGADDGGASIEITGGTEPYEILWSNGEMNTSEVTGLFIDSYFVEVLDANGCLINIPFEIFIGITENDAQQVSVYPNPANDFVRIEATSPISGIWLVNSLGEIVICSVDLHNNVVNADLQSLPKGVYHIIIMSASGADTCTRKLVIN